MPDISPDNRSPLAEQIACVRREIGQRHRVYPRLIDRGVMSQNTARRETQVMEAVLATLLELSGDAPSPPPAQAVLFASGPGTL